jgi:hypothetical protein
MSAIVIQIAFVFWLAATAPKTKMSVTPLKNDGLMVERQRF